MNEPTDKMEWLRPQEIATRLQLKVRTIYQYVYHERIPAQYVRKLLHYAHAIEINWTAIEHVTEKESFYRKGREIKSCNWQALKTRINKN